MNNSKINYVPFTNPFFFELDKDCIRHDNYKCSTCELESQEEYKNKERIQQDITLVPLNEARSARDACAHDEAISDFRRQVSFVQKVLVMDDAKIEKVKIKNLAKLIKKAQEEATVGNMKQLIREDRQNGFARFIDHFICSCKRRFF